MKKSLANILIQKIDMINESDENPMIIKRIEESWVPANGDIVSGDVIKFKEAVFGGSFKKPKYMGDRVVTAEVISDSYGQKKQQHTFTIKIIQCTGFKEIKSGTITTRKGRNLYRDNPDRLQWEDEDLRNSVAEEKHERGRLAREQKKIRKEMLNLEM